MRTKLVAVSLLVLLGIALWFIQFKFPNSYLNKVFFTVLALLIIYAVIKIIFEQIVANGIRNTPELWGSVSSFTGYKILEGVR